QSMARMGRCTIVGVAGGSYEWSFFTTPYESTLTNTYWGTIEELHEVVDMYRAGQIVPDIERYSLDDGLDAYRKLQAGELSRRAVVVPHGNWPCRPRWWSGTPIASAWASPCPN